MRTCFNFRQGSWQPIWQTRTMPFHWHWSGRLWNGCFVSSKVRLDLVSQKQGRGIGNAIPSLHVSSSTRLLVQSNGQPRWSLHCIDTWSSRGNLFQARRRGVPIFDKWDDPEEIRKTLLSQGEIGRLQGYEQFLDCTWNSMATAFL